MPLFEYQCETCNEQFEKRVSFSESDLLPDCPVCGSKETQKKISMFATSGNVTFGSASTGASGCGGAGGFT